MQAGRLDVTVFRDSRGQGGMAVETVLKTPNREPFEREVFIPFRLVTRGNVGEYIRRL